MLDEANVAQPTDSRQQAGVAAGRRQQPRRSSRRQLCFRLRNIGRAIRRGLLTAALAYLGGLPAEAAEIDAGAIEEIIVTGSRIHRTPLDESAPTLHISEASLDSSGLTNLGAALQQLPIAGSAINTRFNVPGNFGFPQDGAGIGAGAVQLSLRNLGAKRTLVLVDGRRWIAGASASGVPSTVDLNSLPSGVIERVEILQDGASAIYGSDAIGGVVNLITKQGFRGLQLSAQTGKVVSHGDGTANELSALWGGTLRDGATEFLLSAQFAQEKPIFTSERTQSAFPNPFGRSCDDGGCSSFTPQGRFVLGPNLGGADLALNDGVLNDGGDNLPAFDLEDPTGGDFHAFTSADRFNYNGNRYNFLQTPNRRLNLHAQISHEMAYGLRFIGKATYAKRRSTTKGAPEPLCLGNGCGNRFLNNVVISADQPYNPFGADLSVANGNLAFMGRRPLESGPRLFKQNVETWFFSTRLEGQFGLAGRTFLWDLNASHGRNRGAQRKDGAHNAAKLVIALGDPAVCAATPGCTPFNFFGGQGPDGRGSITQEMLDFVGFVQRDYSRQKLSDYAGNLTGDLLRLPAGPLAFAAGFEHRAQDGWYKPDPVAERGETAGIPAGATRGRFKVTEFYAELNAPLLDGVHGAERLEINAAARRSEYSNFGAENTYKLGLLWRPFDGLALRGTLSTGIRAPGIGELFGGAAREDFTFLDPCADVQGLIGAGNGGRSAPQPQPIIDNCATLGLPPDLAQRNPQLAAVSAGNEDLRAETSESWMLGFAYRPAWGQGGWLDALSLSADYHSVEIEDAIQGRAPADLIQACVETLDPAFCQGVQRDGQGMIELVDNRLQNIGGIKASGWDLALAAQSPPTAAGQFRLTLNATRLSKYIERIRNPNGSLTTTEFTGTLTEETFQRAFPKWRFTTKLDWQRGNWAAGLTLRYVSRLTQPNGDILGSEAYLDMQIRREALLNGRLTATLGANNLLNNDPAICTACGIVNMSLVAHDLPGVVGYLRMVVDL